MLGMHFAWWEILLVALLWIIVNITLTPYYICKMIYWIACKYKSFVYWLFKKLGVELT